MTKKNVTPSPVKRASIKPSPVKSRMTASTARRTPPSPVKSPAAIAVSGSGYTGSIVGTKLTLEIDLAHELGLSESGKSILLASAKFAELPGQDVTTWLNLLICRKVVK